MRLAIFLAAFFTAAPLQAAETPLAEGDGPSEEASRTLVEIFLSQACEACPKAAALLPELAARPEIVALAWHVDLWDFSGMPKRGRWADPFARVEHSQRQKAYNQAILGRHTVFTPQAIIDGRVSAVASKMKNIDRAIESSSKESSAGGGTLRFELADAQWRVTAQGSAAPAALMIVRFRTTAETEIRAGGNAGQTWREANVVTASERRQIGVGEFISLPQDLGESEGCAVLLESPESGQIHDAAYCPSSTPAADQQI